MKICALIPVYNNAGTVRDIVHRCGSAIGSDILVVADGSTDGSDKNAYNAGAEVIVLNRNRGKGQAIKKGLEVAHLRGYTHAIVLDADGQHLPEEIPRFCDLVSMHPSRIWVGVRRMDQSSMPKASRIGRLISNFWTTLNGWQRCRDAQCGFRAYPIEKTLSLRCRETGFSFEMEVLVRASWAGMTIDHLDIDVLYPNKDRVSHFDRRRDNWRFSWLSFKLFWGMVLRIPLLLYRKI